MSSFSLLSRRRLSRDLGQTALFGAVFLGSIAALCALLIVGEIRLAVAVVVGVTLVILATVSIRLSIVATLVYLILMGDIRRLLIPVAGWSGTDPLLLIGPTFVVILTAYVFATKRAQFSTQLAPWILALMVIMALQIMNPRQGGLMVGVAGAMFYIIPLLWYWIGQVYATPKFVETILFRVVVPLAFVAISVGLYQVFFGYMPHQQMWFDCCAYTALGVDGIQAPISVFASAIEYSVFTIVAAIILWALYLKRRNPVFLLAIVPLVIAVFLVGSRGPIAQLLAVGAALWAALSTDTRSWVLRGGIAVIIGGVMLTLALMQVEKAAESVGHERIQHRMERQATGFLHMGDPSKSTATTHKRMMILGIFRGIQNPLGDGLGSTTKAAHKFGRPEGISGSMEVDISNIFLSTGTFGGLIYLYIIFIIIRQSIVYWHSKRTLVGLCLAGLLGVTFLSWLAGGRYALAPLIWFAVGSLDRFYTDHLDPQTTDE
jgi:hypothetical protein